MDVDELVGCIRKALPAVAVPLLIAWLFYQAFTADDE